MRKSIRVAFLLTLILAALPLVSQAAPLAAQASPMKSNWRAEYYANPSLSGQPVISRIESQISQDWGYDAPTPDLPPDHFSARWTTKMRFKKGTYLIFLTVDDGARVWFDGKLLIDAWDIGKKKKLETRLRLDADGEHEVQVAYFEHTGHAAIVLESLQLTEEDEILGAWQAEYFNNKELAGTPTLSRQEGCVCFSWDFGSPDSRIGRDNFSARWTRSIFLPRPGLYTFRIQHDDGMRIYVDGKIIYESWYDQSVSYNVREIPLKEGFRTFTVEYYEHTGQAVAYVSIDGNLDDHDHADPDQTGGAGVIVDNNNAGFQWTGPAESRFVSQGGYGKNFYWTHNTRSDVVNSGRWTAPVGSAGNYEIFAYIPASRSTTQQARYQVYHFGQVNERVINQNSYGNEFVSLGTYYFGGGGNEFVRLQDNTGESDGTAEIAFDALKFVRR